VKTSTALFKTAESPRVGPSSKHTRGSCSGLTRMPNIRCRHGSGRSAAGDADVSQATSGSGQSGSSTRCFEAEVQPRAAAGLGRRQDSGRVTLAAADPDRASATWQGLLRILRGSNDSVHQGTLGARGGGLAATLPGSPGLNGERTDQSYRPAYSCSSELWA
jgi:hypothetical protein